MVRNRGRPNGLPLFLFVHDGGKPVPRDLIRYICFYVFNQFQKNLLKLFLVILIQCLIHLFRLTQKPLLVGLVHIVHFGSFHNCPVDKPIYGFLMLLSVRLDRFFLTFRHG